jgi:hypothetical protein
MNASARNARFLSPNRISVLVCDSESDKAGGHERQRLWGRERFWRRAKVVRPSTGPPNIQWTLDKLDIAYGTNWQTTSNQSRTSFHGRAMKQDRYFHVFCFLNFTHNKNEPWHDGQKIWHIMKDEKFIRISERELFKILQPFPTFGRKRVYCFVQRKGHFSTIYNPRNANVSSSPQTYSMTWTWIKFTVVPLPDGDACSLTGRALSKKVDLSRYVAATQPKFRAWKVFFFRDA